METVKNLFFQDHHTTKVETVKNRRPPHPPNMETVKNLFSRPPQPPKVETVKNQLFQDHHTHPK